MNWLIYLLRGNIQNSSNLSIFTSEVQLITTSKLPACRVYQASTFKLQIDQHVLICPRMV